MICRKCGTKCDDNASYCTNCGSYLKEEDVYIPTVIQENDYDKKNESQNLFHEDPVETSKEKKDMEKATKIFLIAYAVCIVFSFLGVPFAFLAALMIIIAGRIECPNSTAIKVLFWITIILAIIGIFLVVWFMSACISALQSCPG